MYTILRFDDRVYEFLKENKLTQVLRSRVYRLNSKKDQNEYQSIITKFKKWVYYFKPYEFNGTAVNEIFFDFERMISEYSLHYGIKSGSEMINEGSLKSTINHSVKSLEAFIEDSLNGLDKHIEKTVDGDIKYFIDDVNSNWKKSFLINCIPNIIRGNYVNIPKELISIEKSIDKVDFIDDEEYFFNFLGRLPIKTNVITIDGHEYFNIVNTSIVPIFISMNVRYIL